MLSPLATSLSGLQAFSTRLQSNANNIANAATEGFKRTRVLNTAQPEGGVRSHSETVAPQGATHYEETTTGLVLVESSTVDLAAELPDMQLNKLLYRASLKALQTADEMLGSLLETKA
ncbi:flagellar basal body rod C-terminal domain-containing protein [Desulfofustis limnaeus]|jgi:flagellar basal-body rod protein FlgC|uniref:Flagellar basal body rod protein n=1 Tax=Desulfofustis limnaeus TaxID=2740163 RepID=A0ABN6M839_9BACT|nr:flagellar basal body rod C-terminal domain-containing protein [Desulfofustis limnaeus]MDX9894454.1 flagellar basal body protein [Desulfofustis sp.]BDD88080.1 hypothetical protein DPPLL_24450 [Desulfofustis limnaeus]